MTKKREPGNERDRRGRRPENPGEDRVVSRLVNIIEHEGPLETRKPKAHETAQIRRAFGAGVKITERDRRRVRRQAKRIMARYGIAPGEAAEPEFATEAERAKWRAFVDRRVRAFMKTLRARKS